MSQLTHLLAADARRFRITMAMWALVAITYACIQHAVAFVEPFSPEGQAVATAASLTWFAGLLLSCALVPWVIQLHPAVGSDAFWMTRPIPPRMLVIAKLVLLTALFVGIPVIVEQVVMTIYRMPSGDLARVAAQSALLRGLLLAILLVPAALTPNFARFALVCGALLFAFAMLPLMLTVIVRFMVEEEGAAVSAVLTPGAAYPIPRPGPDATPLIVGIALLIAGGMAVVATQYHLRRVRYSVVLNATVIAVAIVVTMKWPWPLLRADISPPDWAESPSVLQLSTDAGVIRFESQRGWHAGRPRWTARVPVQMMPAPPGWLATARLHHARLELSREERFSTRTDGYPSALPDPTGRSHEQVAVQQVLGVRRLSGGRQLGMRQDEPGVMLYVPADPPRGTDASTGVFHADFQIDLTRLEVAAVMPRGRAVYQDGAYRVAIEHERAEEFGLMLLGRTAAVTTLLDRRPRPAYVYFLRNRVRAEAVEGSTDVAVSVGFPFTGGFGFHVADTGWGGFSALPRMINFYASLPDRPPEIVLDRQWLDQAELVIVRATHGGSVSRAIEVRDVPVVWPRTGAHSSPGAVSLRPSRDTVVHSLRNATIGSTRAAR